MSPEQIITLLCLPVMFLIVFIVHEFGHYIVARLNGVRISSVTIGAGKTLKQGVTKKNKIPWFFCALPISGHVELKSADMDRLSTWRRIPIILAGPLINIILPFFILVLLFIAGGQPVFLPKVGGVMVDGPAQKAGIKLGDEIIALNGMKTGNFIDIVNEVWELPIEPLTLTIDRNGEIFDVEVMPEEKRYRDNRGLKRHHGMIGLQAVQTFLSLENIKQINDENVPDDLDGIRDILSDHSGELVVIGVERSDEQVYDYKFRMDLANNPDWADPDDSYHDYVFITAHDESYYLRQPLLKSVSEAFKITADRIHAVARIPFQLFPLDRSALKFGIPLFGEENRVKNLFYTLLFKLCLLSVVIGFINLLPLPRLDGSFLLYEIAEKIKNRPLSRREQAGILVTAFLAFYISVLTANFMNMPHYFGKKIEAAQEWINDRDDK